MSSRGRLFTDDALTRTLDHWLADGPKEMPEVSVDAALRTVAITGQRRWRGRLVRFASASPMVPVGVSAATIAVVVMLAVAFGQILPPPATLPSPTPDSTSSPALGLRFHTNDEDGYELLAPAPWVPPGGDAPLLPDGVAAFGQGTVSFPQVWVSFGQPSGEISICNSSMYCGTSVIARTIDELDAKVVTNADLAGVPRLAEERVAVDLDGEPARHVDVRGLRGTRSPVFDYVFAVHDGRPVIIGFDHWSTRTGQGRDIKGAVLESFRFLGQGPDRIVYTNEEDGYEVTLPASWTPAEFPSNPPGAMRFGAAHNDYGPSPFGAFTVSIGSPDGTVYDCAPAACVPIVATTLDDLDAQVDSWNRSATAANLDERDEDITLDGVPARLETVALRGGLIEAGPQFHHIFAFHEGRPVILSFDLYAYNLGRAANSVAWVHRLIESFRFMDSADPSSEPSPSPSTQMLLYTNPEIGFEIAIEPGWELRELSDDGQPARSAVGFGQAMDMGYPALTVSVGSADGTVLVCPQASRARRSMQPPRRSWRIRLPDTYRELWARRACSPGSRRWNATSPWTVSRPATRDSTIPASCGSLTRSSTTCLRSTRGDPSCSPSITGRSTRH
jgi:hypothetical protein